MTLNEREIVKMKYPKGSIRTEAEIHSLGKCNVWEASQMHSRGKPHMLWISGDTGTQRNNKREYHYFKCYFGEEDYKSYITSLLDRNIPEPNNYNDWFLFTNLADAEAYLKN